MLISMFEIALPMSYSVIKQMTRRENHPTLLAYYNDVLCQVRAELSSRGPTVHAFAAGAGAPEPYNAELSDATVSALAALGLQRIAAPPTAATGGRGTKGRGGRAAAAGRGGGRGAGAPGAFAYPANPCLRCCAETHNRGACPEPKIVCRFCQVGDHHPAYCPKNPTAGAKRKSLSEGARNILARECGSATGAAQPLQ
jgi:hypothetical protein